LRKKLNLVLYVPTGGDEFWLNGPSVFPVEVEIAQLKFEKEDAGKLKTLLNLVN
jgi:hypothetical protein